MCQPKSTECRYIELGRKRATQMSHSSNVWMENHGFDAMEARSCFHNRTAVRECSNYVQYRRHRSFSLTSPRCHYTLGELTDGYSPRLAIGVIFIANKAKIVACKGLGRPAQIPRHGPKFIGLEK